VILIPFSFSPVIFCCSTKSNNQLCITEFLDNLQSIVGPLSTNNLVTIGQEIINGNSTVTIPKNDTCNDCTQAAWAIIMQDVPSVASDSTITGPIASTCGESFLNGTKPTDIVESSGSASPSQNAALGTHITYERFVGVAVVPLIGLLIGSAILF
jgi:hypothetical protein